jgi:hypothetical protein
MKVTHYEHVYDKKTLKAFFTLEIPEWHLTIERMGEYQKGERRWVAPPFYLTEEDGNKRFHPYISFKGAAMDKFLFRAREALDEYLVAHQLKVV